MIIAQVATSISSLDNHLLARDRSAGEGQLVAGAAPCHLVATGDVDSSPAIGERLVHGPGTLARAHVGTSATVAARSGVSLVIERAVVLVAGLDLAVVGLLWPTAGGFAG